MKTLVIDVGGTHIKAVATGHDEPIRITSGTRMTAARMVKKVLDLSRDWDYAAVSIGYPGRVGREGPVLEPVNLGRGWVGFDFAAALGRPVKVINDAVMQALGSYNGGRMLFLGLGTGLGSTLIVDKTVVPLDVGRLPFRRTRFADYLNGAGRKKLGQKEWQRVVEQAVPVLKSAFHADYLVLGGGNAERVNPIPEGARRGSNENAFRGGFRLWETDVALLEHISPAHMYKLLY